VSVARHTPQTAAAAAAAAGGGIDFISSDVERFAQTHRDDRNASKQDWSQ